MLTLDGHPTGDVPASLSPDTIWIDMLDCDPAEIAWVEQQTGLHVPTPAELTEIETSSRLRFESGVFRLSTPTVSRDPAGMPVTTALGLVLGRKQLITVRQTRLTAFTTFGAAWASEPGACGADAFVGLIDAIVDRMAYVLEAVGAELDTVSYRVFAARSAASPSREDAGLRDTLRQIGNCGDLASRIRDSLLCVARIIPYVLGQSIDWIPQPMRTRMETQRADIASLNDYDTHLTNKVQLLLDATLGLISIEQNNIIKVLTVVSVVGVPPTLVASIYGMNFHAMPELEWAWGYPYALGLILTSAIGPLIWFKLRGWL